MKDDEIFDDREFTEALKLYESQSSKDFVEVVNKASIDACFLFSPEAESMKVRDISKFDPLRKRGKGYGTRLFYALAAKNGARRGQGIEKDAERRYNRRKEAKGYIKAMFLKCAKDLGANVSKPVPKDTEAARGTGDRAKTMRLAAYISTGLWKVKGMDLISKPFERALMRASQKMKAHAEKRMAATAAKYSAK